MDRLNVEAEEDAKYSRQRKKFQPKLKKVARSSVALGGLSTSPVPTVRVTTNSGLGGGLQQLPAEFPTAANPFGG